VRSRGVYPGIDMLYHGNQDRLECDFELAAGSDPNRIRLAFEGIDEPRIDTNGGLLLRSGSFEVRQPKPIAYQLAGSIKTPVSVAYSIDAAHHVRFRTGRYDHKRPLVIDPEIVFSRDFPKRLQ
jgi:hypothetical protein